MVILWSIICCLKGFLSIVCDSFYAIQGTSGYVSTGRGQD